MLEGIVAYLLTDKCTVYWTDSFIYCYHHKKRLIDMYRIVNTRGHIQVYDLNGNFLFSADSEREVREELEIYAKSAA